MPIIQHSSVPGGAIVYAIGDLHGRADLLSKMHRLIAADAALIPMPRKVLVYLGDYVDRGPHSSTVIEILTAPPLQGFETVFLKGNHEDMMLTFLDGWQHGSIWMQNGGMETLASYGVDPGALPMDAKRLQSAQDAFLRALPPSHLDFFRGLPAFHVEGDYFFAHAGVRPETPLAAQQEHDLMWIRGEFLNCHDPFGKIVVHGHTITPSPCVRQNRIGIDTGAFHSGRLTCLVLEGGKRRFLQT